MSCLSRTYGLRVLQTRRSSYSSEDISFLKLNKFAIPSQKPSQATPIRSNLSRARDAAAVSDRTDLEALENPTPSPTYEALGNARIFIDEHLWSAFEIAEAVGGEIVRWGSSGTISTDTRTLLPGQWFFAISGGRYDGHDFINEALADQKGCAGIIGNRASRSWRNGFIRVEGDTIAALEKMAKFSRDRFCGIVVGLTGSVGKTTTRTMIAFALGSLGRIYQTRRNQNSSVGVPLTMIGLPLDAKAAVVELGMSRKGEILASASICCPSVRVILNVGCCHLESLHSLENVAKAKGELLAEVKPGDLCVLNGDDPLVMSIPVPPGAKKVLFGRGGGCDVRLVLAESINGGRAVRAIIESSSPKSITKFKSEGKRAIERAELTIHGPGLHLAINACAAAAVGVSLGVPLPQIAEALARFRPPSMRSQLIVTGSGITIISDAYNASPPSMAAAIEALKAVDCAGRRVCILADMLELGASEAAAHEFVLGLCCVPSIGRLVLVGRRFLAAARSLELLDAAPHDRFLLCSSDADSLALRVSDLLVPGDAVLVKGSRGMEMGKVVSAIIAQC